MRGVARFPLIYPRSQARGGRKSRKEKEGRKQINYPHDCVLGKRFVLVLLFNADISERNIGVAKGAFIPL